MRIELHTHRAFWLCAPLLAVLLAPRANAIPLFGRIYGKSCFTCHVTEPMLNEFGRRFQANGYQIPFTTPTQPVWDQLPLLFAIVGSPSVTHTETTDHLAGATAKSTAFDEFGVDVLTAGNFSSDLSWYGDITVDPSEGAGIESLFLISHLGMVNVSFGKQILKTFLPIQFTPTNSDYIAQAYDPYAVAGIADAAAGGGAAAHAAMPKVGDNPLLLEEASYAVSAFGWIPDVLDGFRYQAAVTSGNAGVELSDNYAVFLSADQTVFYANNAPLRIGGWAYAGKQTVAGDSSAAPTDHPLRFGAGVDIYDPWLKRFNLAAEYIGANDDRIFDGTAYAAQSMSGGFVALTAIVCPEKFYAYARYDAMNVKKLDYKENQVTLECRYHFLPNVLLWAEVALDAQKVNSGQAFLPHTDTRTTTVSLGTMFGF